MPVTNERAKAAAKRIVASQQADIFLYSGQISRAGYAAITRECCACASRGENAYLVLITYGGDPDAAYRIIRALRHYYKSLTILVPAQCKSAGTLMLIGASKLVLCDQSELGPLDVQVSKPDEIAETGSGLDVLQSLGFLQQNAISHFTNFLLQIKFDSGITAKTAAEIASKLTIGLFQPLYSQIDPARLAELQRATGIAMHYGERLRKDYETNISEDGLKYLVTGYPSHSFVIDRREARSLFNNVTAASDDEADLGEYLDERYGRNAGAAPSVINIAQILDLKEVEADERSKHDCGGATDPSGASGDQRGVPALVGAS